MRRSTTTSATPAEGAPGSSAAPAHRDGWRGAWDADAAALLMDDLLTDSASAMPEACDGSATRPLPTNLLTAELLTDTAFAISEACDASATKPLPTNLLTAELLTDGPSPPTTEPLPPGDAPATHRATTGPLALTPLTVDRFTGEPRPAGLLP